VTALALGDESLIKVEDNAGYLRSEAVIGLSASPKMFQRDGQGWLIMETRVLGVVGRRSSRRS